jgi:hypothetical protein
LPKQSFCPERLPDDVEDADAKLQAELHFSAAEIGIGFLAVRQLYGDVVFE